MKFVKNVLLKLQKRKNGVKELVCKSSDVFCKDMAARVFDCAELDLQQCRLLSSDNYIGEVEKLATSLDRGLSCIHTRSLRV